MGVSIFQGWVILGETVCGLLGTYWQEKRKIIWNNSGSSVLPGSTWSTDSPLARCSHRQPDLALHPPSSPVRPQEGSLPLHDAAGDWYLAAHVLMAFAETADMFFRKSESPLPRRAFCRTDLKSYQVIKNILSWQRGRRSQGLPDLGQGVSLACLQLLNVQLILKDQKAQSTQCAKLTASHIPVVGAVGYGEAGRVLR